MEYAMELRNLRKEYKQFTLDNISLSLPMGSIMGFIGENGAGKSTTIKAMLGLIRRDDIVAIDTGCLWGGKLTAVRFPDRRIYQEDCPCWADPFKYK